MTKDFKNNLTLLLIASIFAVCGWTASVFVDGNLIKEVCVYSTCLQPIHLSIFSLGILGVGLLLIFFI